MVPLRTKSDLVESLAQPRAFVFLWVNWAVHARSSQQVVDEVLESWQTAHPDLPAPCHIADLSEQGGEVWDAVAEWLARESRPAGQLMLSGVGPLLWLREGRIVAHVLNANQFGAAKLLAASSSIWSPDTAPA